MSFSSFEKYTRQTLQQHHAAIDAEALWANLEPKVVKSPPKRRGFFWLFLGLGLSAFVAAGWWWSTDQPSAAPSDQLSATEEPTASTPSTAALEISTSDTDQQAAETDATTVAVAPSANQPTHSTKTTANSITPSSTPITTKTVSALSRSDQTDNTPAASIAMGNNAEVTMTSDASEVNLTVSPELNDDSPKSNSSIDAAPEEVNTLALQIVNLTVGPPALAFEPLIPLSFEKSEDQRLRRRRGAFVRNLRYGVGAYVGVGRPSRTLEAREGTPPAYEQVRLNTEKQQESIQAGLELMVQSEQGFYFRTGLQYERIASKFTFNSTITRIDTIEGVQQIIINNFLNDTTEIMGPVPHERTTTFDKITYNNFHIIDVPLILGYNFSQQNWTFGLEAGVTLNIRTSLDGEVFDPELNFYDLATDEQSWYKTNIGARFQAGITAGYLLDNNWQIYFSPRITAPANFNSDESPIRHKYSGLSFRTGVRFFFD